MKYIENSFTNLYLQQEKVSTSICILKVQFVYNGFECILNYGFDSHDNTKEVPKDLSAF